MKNPRVWKVARTKCFCKCFQCSVLSKNLPIQRDTRQRRNIQITWRTCLCFCARRAHGFGFANSTRHSHLGTSTIKVVSATVSCDPLRIGLKIFAVDHQFWKSLLDGHDIIRIEHRLRVIGIFAKEPNCHNTHSPIIIMMKNAGRPCARSCAVYASALRRISSTVISPSRSRSKLQLQSSTEFVRLDLPNVHVANQMRPSAPCARYQHASKMIAQTDDRFHRSVLGLVSPLVSPQDHPSP